MEEEIYKCDDYKIFPASFESGEPVDWQEPSCYGITKYLTNPGSPREYFFNRGLNKMFDKKLHELFIDPNGKTLNIEDKTKSGLFELIDFYKDDTESQRKEFIKNLVNSELLECDQFKIIKCKCKKITLGSGDYCSDCKKRNKDSSKYKIYKLTDELKNVFFQPGRIIEGVLFNFLNETFKESDVEVSLNPILKSEEGEEKQELDIVLTHKGNVFVILSTINPQGTNEKKQMRLLEKYNIPSLFITTRNERKSSGLIKIIEESENNPQIEVMHSICDTSEDFLQEILSKINNYFNI